MSAHGDKATTVEKSLMSLPSYEALPPNFSVLENCFAGAFAGIAVYIPSTA